jgi:hypothetical protein
MDWKRELKTLLWLVAGFLVVYFLPVGREKFDNAVLEAFRLLKWYAREHVLLCLVPAFLIAGIISVFISADTVIKYFGSEAKKWLSYLVASVSGTILAVCSCTILPLFSSIHKRGAGLGPAVAFLYSGPAINILAIILTARILGWEIGLARVVGAVTFSIVIGMLMAFFFRKEERQRKVDEDFSIATKQGRPLWQSSFHFFVLVLILIFVNWGKPAEAMGVWHWIWIYKWWVTAGLGAGLLFSLVFFLGIRWQLTAALAVVTIVTAFLFPHQPQAPFLAGIIGMIVISLMTPGEPRAWMEESWWFARQIIPLLAIGVLVAGLLMGTSADTGLIPGHWISGLVGGNSLPANLIASVVGAFMYFATLTEVPIIQGLLGSGMGQGPALALLLAGPALSLPSMLVIYGVIGLRKTIAYIILVVTMATFSGWIFGMMMG